MLIQDTSHAHPDPAVQRLEYNGRLLAPDDALLTTILVPSPGQIITHVIDLHIVAAPPSRASLYQVMSPDAGVVESDPDDSDGSEADDYYGGRSKSPLSNRESAREH